MGRIPTPTNLRILRGNPGRGPLNDQEPRPDADRVRCPARLSKGAKKIWREISPHLKTLGLLTNVDIGELAKYCEFEAIYRKHIGDVEEYGTHVPIRESPTILKDGTVITKGRLLRFARTPAFDAALEAGHQASRIAAKFGLTPSDRTGLKVSGRAADESTVEEYLRRRGQER